MSLLRNISIFPPSRKIMYYQFSENCTKLNKKCVSKWDKPFSTFVPNILLFLKYTQTILCTFKYKMNKYTPEVCVEPDCIGTTLSSVVGVLLEPLLAPRYWGVAHNKSFRIWMIVLISRLGRPKRSCNAGFKVPKQD